LSFLTAEHPFEDEGHLPLLPGKSAQNHVQLFCSKGGERNKKNHVVERKPELINLAQDTSETDDLSK
tara:strand:+ start:1442 stop:1642 length:201 start_codon:yes stop_codon:yes gene_type:complete